MGLKVLNSLNQFLDDYPGMSIAPHLNAGVCLRGNFRFIARVDGCEEIEDSYKLEIIVPEKFPRALPTVKEIDGKIPKCGTFHVNPDGTICLGTPLSLLKIIYNYPTLCAFVSNCLIPYLYAVSYKLKHGGDFIFGWLPHAQEGIIVEYLSLFALKEPSQIELAIKMLGVKKRIANKRPCPCGCKKKLGKCGLHAKINSFRKMAPVSWFRAQAH